MEQAINVQSLAQKRRTYFKHPGSLIVFLLTWLAALLTMGVLVFLIGYILIKGVPFLTPDLFKLEYNSDNVSMLPALINTLLMTVLALLIAGPLGIFAAIYMVEYAKKGNKVVGVVRVTAETLSGIPSIVYGLFGALFFVTFLHLRLSLISGALTVAIMVLPTILRTTEEALIAVPASFREGSFGLGAGKLRTVFRIVGETAALIYTAGTTAKLPKNLLSSTRTLSVHMYMLSGEGFHTDQAFATAVILLILVIVINLISNLLASRLTAKGIQK